MCRRHSPGKSYGEEAEAVDEQPVSVRLEDQQVQKNLIHEGRGANQKQIVHALLGHEVRGVLENPPVRATSGVA